MFKKLAATGILGFAVAGAALASTPAYAGVYGGGHGKGHGKGHGSFNHNKTSGDNSILGGTQVIAPISIPVNVCGVAVGVFGEAQAACKGGASVKN
ncbi:chaplin family protein [Actinomadura sp. 3N508]|uniref:chaplin family protein n=1 Tax=Actinomadura sp. 3N508 TaxID=3375153 RepID=UPI0037B51E02